MASESCRRTLPCGCYVEVILPGDEGTGYFARGFVCAEGEWLRKAYIYAQEVWGDAPDGDRGMKALLVKRALSDLRAHFGEAGDE